MASLSQWFLTLASARTVKLQSAGWDPGVNASRNWPREAGEHQSGNRPCAQIQVSTVVRSLVTLWAYLGIFKNY